MRTIITILLLCTSTVYSQSLYYLEHNNIRALLSDNGYFFNDQGNSNAAYEFPKGSNKFAIYSMSYWMGGVDANSQVHVAANMYGSGHDYFPGPIANDYNSTYYQYNFLSSIWPMSKAVIDYHIAHYNDLGYTADQMILNWPGNGNTSEGVAAQLAPYVDVNNNQTYDPLNGDYPFIHGDYAVYTIMNDDAGVHTETGADKLGVEVHSMYYQYSTNNELNNTTFLQLKIINRSSTTYNDFLYGIWMDTDIGNPNNDFAGCDSTRNLGFAYNGETSDGGAGGQSAYGTSPPAVGAVFLNNPMHKFVSFNGAAGAQGSPSQASQYYTYMNGYWKNGSVFTYGGTGLGGTTPTSYIYSGDPNTGTGWSEVSELNATGDRKSLMSTDLGTLSAYDEKCLDIAFVINADSTNNLQNVTNLYNTVDFVQSFYDNNVVSCDQVVATVSEFDRELEFTIFPNPAQDQVQIQVGDSFNYSIYDMKGSIIQSGYSAAPILNIGLNVESGIYLIKVSTEKGESTQKLQVY